MPEEGEGGGGRLFGLHPLVLVAIVAVGAYFLFFRGRGTSGSPSTSGGGGTVTSSGTTTLQKGAVQITVTQAAPGGTKAGMPAPGKKKSGDEGSAGARQPKPPVRRKTATTSAQTDTGGATVSTDAGGTMNLPVSGPQVAPVQSAGVTPNNNVGNLFPKVSPRTGKGGGAGAGGKAVPVMPRPHHPSRSAGTPLWERILIGFNHLIYGR